MLQFKAFLASQPSLPSLDPLLDLSPTPCCPGSRKAYPQSKEFTEIENNYSRWAGCGVGQGRSSGWGFGDCVFQQVLRPPSWRWSPQASQAQGSFSVQLRSPSGRSRGAFRFPAPLTRRLPLVLQGPGSAAPRTGSPGRTQVSCRRPSTMASARWSAALEAWRLPGSSPCVASVPGSAPSGCSAAPSGSQSQR